MSVAPVLLNKHFKVLSFTGGIAGDNGSSVLDIVSADPFYSKKGSGFDMLLQYDGPEELFTLTHLAFTPPEGTAPLKTVGVWVHPAGGLPDIAAYSSRFQMDEDAYAQSQGAMRPSPAPTAFFGCKRRDVTGHAIATPVAGKYIHFRFVNAHAGDNIDIGQIGIVGTVGATAPVAVVDVKAASSAAQQQGGLGKLDWGAMFNASSAKKADAAPEVYELLSFLGACNLPVAWKGVNTPFGATAAMEMGVPFLVLVSKIPLYEALLAHRAGTATADQATVANHYTALSAAMKLTKGRKFAMYIDPLTEAVFELANLAKVHSNVPKGADAAELVFPEGVEGPCLLVCCHGSDEVYAFHEQDQEDLATAGAALRAKAARGAPVEALLKQLTVSAPFAKADAVIGFLAAEQLNLKAFVASAPAPANDVHPTLPGVKVVTQRTFSRLVLDSERPVLMILDMENWAASNERVVALAQVLARNNLPVDVVIGNPDNNSFDTDFIDSQAVGVAAFLFVKSDADAAAATAAGKKGGVSFKLEGDKVAVLGNVTSKNASGKTVRMYSMALKKVVDEDDEDEHDEDEDEDEDGENDAPRFLNPSPGAVLEFIKEAGVEILVTDDIQKDLDTVNKFCGVSAESIAQLNKLIATLRVGPKQKYAFLPGSKAATESAPFFEWASLLTEYAILKGAADGATMWENIEAVARLYPAAMEGTGQNVRVYVARVKSIREVVQLFQRSLNKFRTQLAADIVSAVEGVIAEASALLGEALPAGLSAKDAEAWIERENAEEQVYVDMDKVGELQTKMAEVFKRAQTVLVSLDADARSASGFDEVAFSLTEPDQFIRVASGLPPVAKPVKAAKKGAKPRPEQPVENAQERIVALYCALPGMVAKAEYAEIAAFFKKIASEAAEEGTEAPAVVFYCAGTEMLEQLSGSLAVPTDELPAVLFFQNGQLIEQKRNITVEGFRDYVELTISGAQYGDMPGFGAGEEGDEGFEGDESDDEEVEYFNR